GVREREYEDQMRKAQVEKTHRERKTHEAFKDLLRGLVDAGKIKARTKWKEVYPNFATDERHLFMLGNPGSNPLELFWDVVNVLDQELDRNIAVIDSAFERHNAEQAEVKVEGDMEVDAFAVGPETKEKEFRAAVKTNKDDAMRAPVEKELVEIFITLHEAAVEKQAEESAGERGNRGICRMT
ncbi:hypothetical protein DXG01_014849, partial [Tephrocybe rancida]